MKRSWLVCLVGGLSQVIACGDDAPAVDTADSSSSDGGESEDTLTTTQTTLSTSADSSSSESSGVDTNVDSSESSSSEGESSSSDSSGSSTETGDLCGNDMLDDGEVCDGSDLAGQDCASQDFDGGTLGCNASCSAFDTSMCTLADCGDGMISGRETCDGVDLGGATCESLGYDAGTLACAPSCAAFNFTGCSECGDNNQNGSEVCDGDDFNGATCETEGFAGGTLTCAADCSGFDTLGCDACGNGVIDADGEICDSPDFAGANCLDYGFTAGLLACTDNCGTIDASGCFDGDDCVEEDIGSDVGNAVASGSNVGEDNDVAESCGNTPAADHMIQWIAPANGTYRFDTVDSSFDTVLSLHNDCVSPSLVCNDDLGFNGNRDSRIVTDVVAGQILIISVSGFGVASGDWVLNINLDGEGAQCCTPHGIAGCDSDDGTCEPLVCAINPDCCNALAPWSAECVTLAVANCTSCQDVCGNNLVEDEEICDGTDLASETCATQGFDFGDLDCAGDCTLDSSDCGNFEGDCCSDNGPGSPGCDDDSCTTFVCAENPECCDQNGTWDATCAGIAATACAVCNPDACGNNVVEGVEVCDGIDLAGGTCVTEGFLYGDIGCAGDCTAFDTSSCNDIGACVEESLGSAVGDAVTTGMNAGEDDDVVEGCGFGTVTDHVMSWVAPGAGNYRFTTDGSNFDTVLSLHSDCDAAALACDDDGGLGTQSQLFRDVAAGETLLINVTGFSTNVGTWQLNINLEP
ncbi:MAG: hypothetical protein IAG13_27290 [Deltaproteobacteria bacterium]|nr:hypothetical protein [Nannocystaceae bacterium]